MIEPKSMVDRTSEADQEFDALICEVSAKLEAGQSADLDAIATEHPEHVERLRKLLPTLQAMAELGHLDAALSDHLPESDRRPEPTQRVLGDFRIIREVGRGGMGVVYEAEQASLGRHVALKVLPFAAVLDQRPLARFKKEAHAAAQLHHTNIVPVFSVGCERGVHYYAMQFVEGETLAQVIGDLRGLEGIEGIEGDASVDAVQPGLRLADNLASGRFAPPSAASSPERPTSACAQEPTPPDGVAGTEARVRGVGQETPPETDAKVQSQAFVSTDRSTRNGAYFRSVANLGIQVAKALDHAHEHGVIHRDVKPSNVILDGEGKAWVTDFGLARVETDATLTISGDVLGTIRYMSPEQALADRAVVDHRTDIYSLGVTLYELLTLRPAFPGRDRQRLLRQITIEEPRPPRALNKSIPGELETIVLKAIAKTPEERYATAQELADDLDRFLEDMPIRAKRPSLVQRAAKWSRRHRPIVVSAAIAAALILVTITTGALAVANKERIARDAAEAAKDREAGLRRRAEAAEREKSQLLWKSYLSQARALRWTGRPGQRFDGLDALEKAGEVVRSLNLPENELENALWALRSEAIACMDLADIRLVKKWDFDDRFVTAFDVKFERYARGDAQGSVAIHRVADDRELLRLPGLGHPTWLMFFSPDGRFLAVRHAEQCKVWDLNEPERAWEVAASRNTVEFSPDSRSLAIGQPDGFIRLYDPVTGEETQRIESASEPEVVRFHPGGRKLAVCSGSQVGVWDLDAGAVSQTFTASGSLNDVAWSRDGQMLAAACRDFNVYAWNVGSGRLISVMQGHRHHAIRVSFGALGNLLVSGGHDQTIRLWEPAGETQLLVTPGRCLGSSADGQLLAYWHGYEVGIWELAGGTGCSVLRGHVGGGGPWSIDTSPDGRLVASASSDGVRIWDWPTGEQVAHLPVGVTRCTFFLPDDGGLVTAAPSGLLRWPMRLKSGQSTLEIGPPQVLDASAPSAYQFFASGAADGQWIASMANSSDVHVFRWADPDHRVVLANEGGVENPIISPDGSWVVVGSGAPEPSVAGYDVWDVQGGEVVAHLEHPAGHHLPMATFSPDGKWLVTGRGREYRFWQVGSWKLERRIPMDFSASGALAFSRDGGVLAIAYSAHAIRLFDMATWQQLAVLESTVPNSMRWLSFSAEADKLAAACLDYIVLVWDLRQIRRQLAAMQLDWDQPPYPLPETPSPTETLRVHVEMGNLQRN
jgi:WD40 repeat protein